MKNNYRPQVELQRTAFDKFIDNFGFASLLVLLVLPAMAYSDLPDTIPIHFDVNGNPDGFGEKYMIFLLPIIGIFTYVAMKYFIKKPHLFNYPVEITEENAAYQYQVATQMLRTMNAIITLVFAYLVYVTIQTAQGNANAMGNWSLSIILAMTLVPTIYFVWKARQGK